MDANNCSVLKIANEFFRRGQYSKAIVLYKACSSVHPEMGDMMAFNILLAERRLSKS